MENIHFYQSPLGLLELNIENDMLIFLKPSNLKKINNIDTKYSKHIKNQLDEYFIGKRKQFDIKINPKGTFFQKKVWNELLKIPYGEKKNYSDIAYAIGNINSSRAIGNACNKNPIMIIIPCHRVIPKKGNIGGFAYGSNIKEKLLTLEKYYI